MVTDEVQPGLVGRPSLAAIRSAGGDARPTKLFSYKWNFRQGVELAEI
jgi:hypothetical protein